MQTHISRIQARLMSRQFRVYILSVGLTFILTFSLFPSTVFAAGNDHVYADLRVDLTSVNSARDYIVSIQMGGLPVTGGSLDFTAGWLGIDVPTLLQVGYMTKKAGVHWFIEEFSSGTLQCFQGTYKQVGAGGEACYGDFYDHASIGNWHRVELVNYSQGYWIARVNDQYGNPLDVAQIHASTNNISRAMVETEEGYTEASDPYIRASFWHNHPKYMIWGTGFQDWPASPSPGVKGSHNKLLTSPARPLSICPDHYIARLNWFGNDPRIWYAGSAGPTPATCYADPIW